MERYLAFISYRHTPESNDAALRIRKGLEGYHLPKGCSLPKRRRVFRDTDELPTSSDLGTDIENALEDSGYLITLCSEDYPKSRWCLREMETFLESGRKDRILPVLLSGTPEISIPEEIRDLPVAADLRDIAPGNLYDRRKIKTAIPRLLASMSGMDSDRIAGAEFRFRAGAAGAAAAVLAAGLLGFAGYASYTAARISENNVLIAEASEETEKEEKQALQERDTALLRQSEYLAEQAWEALENEDTDKAIGLALSALPEDLHGDFPISPEAEGVLRVALSMEMPPSYHLYKTVETDFDITGYYVYPAIEDRLFLTKEPFETAQSYVDYLGETGALETDFAESRQKALDQGYTGLLHLSGDVNFRRHYYYGKGKPLYSEGTSKYYHLEFTLEGEPFYAAGAVLDQEHGGLVAWEDPEESANPRTALFAHSAAEAEAVLEIQGIPVSVSFSSNASCFCVVDEAGTLYIYDNKGVLQKALEGNYTDVFYYYNNGSYACIGSGDGTVTVLDLEDFGEELQFVCPSPVRQVRVNREKDCILVRCDSGVYLYRYQTGSYITEIGSGAAPNQAIWKHDRGNGSSDANMILLIYDRRVELYAVDTDIDASLTDYIPLISEGVPKGRDMTYSQDGKRIFQHSYASNNYVYDPGQDMMFCWDAYTGELIWKHENPWFCYGSNGTQSADGYSIWRVYEGNSHIGIERIDGRTGETLLAAVWPGKYWQPMKAQPVESPDGTRAFLTTQRSSTSSQNRSEMLLVFDTVTGELLWRLDLEKDAQEWREENEAEAAALQEAENTLSPDTESTASSGGEAAASSGEEATASSDEEATASSDEEPMPSSDTETEQIEGIVPTLERQREAKTFKTSRQLQEEGLVLPKERTGFAGVMFSKDGKFIYCVQSVVKSDWTTGLCIDRLGTETGEFFEELFLPLEAQEVKLWEEEEALVLIDRWTDEVNKTDMSIYSGGEWTYPTFAGAQRDIMAEHTVRIFDLARWELTAEIPVYYPRSTEAYNQPLNAVKPFDGGMALYWEAENSEGDGERFCRRLEKDGTLGEILEADSEEGRRLCVSKEAYLIFNGVEAYISQDKILRLSDGVLLLRSAWTSTLQVIQQGSGTVFTEGVSVDRGLSAAKDGTSICMYSPYNGTARTPFLVLPSDLETLVKKGRERIAAAKEPQPDKGKSGSKSE